MTNLKLVALNLVAIALTAYLVSPCFAKQPEGNEAYSGRAVEHFNKAVDLGKDGKFQEAIGEYYSAIKIDPRMVEAYSNLGNAYVELGQYDKAVDAFTKALTLKPGRTTILNALASAFYQSGRRQEARQLWGHIIHLDPNCVLAIYNLGLAFEDEQDYEGAYVAYSKILKLDSKMEPAHERLADISCRIGTNQLPRLMAIINEESARQAVAQAPQNDAIAGNALEQPEVVASFDPAAGNSGLELSTYATQDSSEQFQPSISSVEFVSYSSDRVTNNQFAIRRAVAKTNVPVQIATRPQTVSRSTSDMSMFIQQPPTR